MKSSIDIGKSISDKGLWRCKNQSKFHIKTSESGFHTDIYLNTDYIISDPTILEDIIKIFANEILSKGIKIDRIVTYPPFGIAIAYALARIIGSKFAYVDIKENICNFDIKEGDNILIVGDDLYSGASIQKTINIMLNMNTKIIGPVFLIANFSGENTISGFEIFSILSEKANIYIQEECPMCKKSSQAILPRPNRKKLL